jgi:hypothetical protein
MFKRKKIKTVMGTWREDSSCNLRMGEEQDDEESWGFEVGYSSDRGWSRHSLDWQIGKLRENSSAESEGEDEEERDDTDEENERSLPLFAVAKAGGSNMNSDYVVKNPKKNTRKRKSNIPAVDSLAMATRGKGGKSRQWWHVGSSGSIGFLFYVISKNRLCLVIQEKITVDTDYMLIHPINWI